MRSKYCKTQPTCAKEFVVIGKILTKRLKYHKDNQLL